MSTDPKRDTLAPATNVCMARLSRAKRNGNSVSVASGGGSYRGVIEYIELDPGQNHDFIRVQVKVALPRGERG